MWAKRIKDRIADEDPGALSSFEGLLLSAGFDMNHDYSDFSFLEGNHTAYLVEGDFPRITPFNVPARPFPGEVLGVFARVRSP